MKIKQLKLFLLISLALTGTALATNSHRIYAASQVPVIQQSKQPARQPRIGSRDLIQGPKLRLKRAKAAVALDGRTGQVVYQKNANQKRLVASTGKLMTLYLAEKKLSRDPNGWNQKVRISKPLIRMGYNGNLDGFKFKAKKRYRIRKIFKQAFVASDDNSAIRLGEWVGGSNRHFITLMNRQARKWHLRANFTSASGLENDDLAPYGLWVRGGYYSGNRISAKSLAIIAYHLINDFPGVMRYSIIKETTVDGQRLHNYNNLLPGRKYYERHLHVDGLKTGYTPAAGYCFVGTGKRPGKDRLITVVLDDPTEFSDTDDLMNFVYRNSNLYQ